MITAGIRRLSAPRPLLILSGVVGALLGAGLETCFLEGRYRLIMLLGAAGGLGIALLIRAGLDRWDASRRTRDALLRIWLTAAGPALAVFAIWFLARVLPLIREELKYRI